jgi:hypothetical protein
LNIRNLKAVKVYEYEVKTLANTGHTQNNGAVSSILTIQTAPFFCVCPVH